MKRSAFTQFFLISYTVFLSGCMSVGSSPEPRFYRLQSNKEKMDKQFEIKKDTIILVGPVDIPDYQNRPQIVTQNKNGMLSFSQLDRWGEPLETGLNRTILENLDSMLPGAVLEMFPSKPVIPVKYQVIIDITRFESELTGGLVMDARWFVLDVKTNTIVVAKKSEFCLMINPHTYAGLTQALSSACFSLSAEIAQVLSITGTEGKI